MKKILLGFAILSSLVGCFSKKEVAEVELKQIIEVAQDIQLPKAILAEVEKELTEDSKLLTPVYVFVPLQIELNEKNKGVLQSSPQRFSFPKGGGRLDLKNIITGQGSFYLNFPAEQFTKLPELMHLYYVSQAPVKKIDQENFGLGCGKWVDIKKQFTHLQKADFFKLNTTALRYLYVLSGHYVFVFRENNQIYLSQLTITDSRYENELCFPARENANES